jgi:hypothetical protein
MTMMQPIHTNSLVMTKHPLLLLELFSGSNDSIRQCSMEMATHSMEIASVYHGVVEEYCANGLAIVDEVADRQIGFTDVD